VLDKAEYSAFQSTLNSAIVSYRIHDQLNEILVWHIPNRITATAVDLPLFTVFSRSQSQSLFLTAWRREFASTRRFASLARTNFV